MCFRAQLVGIHMTVNFYVALPIQLRTIACYVPLTVPPRSVQLELSCETIT